MKEPLSYDIVLTGRGGQGVIYLSKIMGQAALLQGVGVRTTETHGMAMRGGSVQCFVRIGEIYGPLFRTGSAALLMALSPAEISLALTLLGEDGTVLVNDRGKQEFGSTSRGVREVLAVDADAIAMKSGNPRSANLALLGGAVAMVKGFPLRADFIEEAISGGPGKENNKNIEIFRQGFERSRNVPA